MCELLAPAGGKEALIAAVQNGADAVYFGGAAFNARAGAENFPSVAEAVAYCHLRGVKAYLTVNTLVRDAEIPALDRALAEAYDAGVDALIVQDLAVAERAAAVAPGVALHLSTQAGVIGASGARFARRAGFERVVLARECAFEDIRAVADEGIGAEVFAHGALCVSYSGRCLMSSMLGGRSGNRGRCAQPCRLPYRMMGGMVARMAVDGVENGATDGGYSGCRGENARGEPGGEFLLSTRDLCILGDLRRFIDAGAVAFKIEGRMRRPEYVALATRAYRGALDAALAGKPYDAADGTAELFNVFNRGTYTRGFTQGDNDAALLNNERPNHGGVQIGSVGKDGTLRLSRGIHKGDSVEYRPSGTGFAVARDVPAGRVAPADGAVAGLARGAPGDALYRTNDAALLERARATYARENRPLYADAVLRAVPGEAAALTLRSAADDARATAPAVSVTVYGGTVERAEKSALTPEDARRRVEKTDGAPLAIRAFSLEGTDAFMPASALNALRRAGIAAWEAAVLDAARPRPARPMPARQNRGTNTPGAPETRAAILQKHPRAPAREPRKPLLIAQTSDPALAAEFSGIAHEVYFAPRDWRPEVIVAAIRRLPDTGNLRLSLPFWLEDPLLSAVIAAASGRVSFAAGSFAAMQALGADFVTDHTVHAFNATAIRRLCALGASRVTLSPELTLAQMRGIAALYPCEAVIHGVLPLMTLRACPTRAAKGLSAVGRESCGLCADRVRCDLYAIRERYDPCAGRERALVDRRGVEFPLRRVMAADGCRVELMNAHTLYMLDRVELLTAAGLAAVRVVTDDAATLRAYADALKSAPDAVSAGRARPDAPVPETPVTCGHFFRGVE